MKIIGCVHGGRAHCRRLCQCGRNIIFWRDKGGGAIGDISCFRGRRVRMRCLMGHFFSVVDGRCNILFHVPYPVSCVYFNIAECESIRVINP